MHPSIPALVEAFAEHEVQTLFDLGSHNLKDNVLVKQLQCDVLVTADRGFEHEHNLKSLRFGIVIVHAARNKVTFYRPLYARLLEAVESIGPGDIIHVGPLQPE